MKILFAGTPSLAVPSLEKIVRAHEVAGVLTSPDKVSGRGRALVFSPVKETALSLRLPLFQPERLDAAFTEQILSLAPDLLAVAAYGRIFPRAFLEAFPLGGINLHPSLLPRFRGPSPISAAILAGDTETGVTIQRIAPRFDTGDILAQERHPLCGDETTAALTASLALEGAELLAAVISGMAAGRPPAPVGQKEEDASYCHPLRKEDGLVRWDESADLIERKVRAYDPWPRCATTHARKTLLLLKSHVYPDTLGREIQQGTSGEVLAADMGHGLLVCTGSGILALERLQEQFRAPLDWRAFLNGHPGFIGARLGV